MNKSTKKTLSFNKLKEIKKEFDNEYSDEYFSIIGPDSLEEFCKQININDYIVQRIEIPTHLLFNYNKLNLWIIEKSKIANIYKGKPYGLIRYSDFIVKK